MNASLLLELIFYILIVQRIRVDVYGVKQMVCQPKGHGDGEKNKIQLGESLPHIAKRVAKNSAHVVAILRSAMEIANALALASIVHYSVLESAWIEKDDNYVN